MSRVLVTGGAGYVGSHACKALAGAGHLPIVFDNLRHGHEWAVRWGPLVKGDIADRACLDAAILEWKPDAVMHFAAFAYVGESVSDPGRYYRNNVAGTLSLLEAMRDHGVDRIVFSSTCATYGIPHIVPIPESHPQQPINPYGAGKLMVERMLTDFAAAHGLRARALRYFNAAGADPQGEIGERHEPETHLIPLALAATDASSPLTIHGNDYDTPDGTCIRDYIHVCDLADAHARVLESMETMPSGFDAYNLGTGRGHSVLEVIAAAELAAGKPVATRIGPRRQGDPAVLVGDASRIRRELGWEPRHSDLGTMIGSAWHWSQHGEQR
ncbi:UDP-glucose 4-epimerase GalE [Arenimonas sp.]|uniref:UDP-glucose 4-epimerase GalE n=1 Tax=Arenimonas sp. TaxID=1872635 RepID=UPI0039E6D14B